MQATCGTQDAQLRAAKTDQMLAARGLLAEQVRVALSKQTAEGTKRKDGAPQPGKDKAARTSADMGP